MKVHELHSIFLDHPRVSTDTRILEKGDIFFALKGDNFNGNKYADQALEKGASFAVIDEGEVNSERKILVDDALETLQGLSNYHRNYCNAKVIGLTGSNGKTTTKELINAVLSQMYRTIATKGNLNNHIGVPLTLLSIKEDTEIAIVEMGANHKKEIEFLCSLAEPDFGYITNFGKAHLEGFGGVEGVIEGKSELYSFLMENGKGVFLNADDPVQKDKLKNYVFKFGFSISDPKFYLIHLMEANPFVILNVEDISINTRLIGSYNFPNCCAAIIMGKYFNVALEHIKAGIEGYVPSNNRSQILEKNGHKLIMDAYNANPSSMLSALENFSNMKADNKMLFLGDMFELGPDAPKEHQEIADLVLSLGFKNAYLIGENFYKVSSEYPKFKTYQDLKLYLAQKQFKNATILIKGSRGMALERILEIIR